jgi:hypothetical protein
MPLFAYNLMTIPYYNNVPWAPLLNFCVPPSVEERLQLSVVHQDAYCLTRIGSEILGISYLVSSVFGIVGIIH